MTEDDEKLLRNARLLLSIALVAAIVSIPALFMAKAGLFMVCWVASFLGALGGVRDSARGTGGNALLMYAGLVLVFVPVANLLPIGYYLWRAIKGLAGEFDAEEPESAPAPKRAPAPSPRKAASATPAAGANPRARLLTAIATVKAAGVDLGGADGVNLKTNVPSAAGMRESDLPVVRGTKGAFAVCYLVDEGSTYAYVNAGELAASGLTLEALHLVGVKNLARQVKQLQLLPQPDGVVGLAMGGQFEASLVLVDSLWDDTLRPHYKTAPVVTVCARDMLAFCDEGNAAGIAGLRAIAERIRTGGSGFMTDKLLVRKQGCWQALETAPAKSDLPPLEFPR